MDTSLNVTNNVGANSLPKNNAIVKRFYVPDAPASYLHGTEGAVNQESRAEIEMRQRRIDDLVAKQAVRRAEVEDFDREVKKFEALAEEYIIAENARNPTPSQHETINTLETSISEIVLSGANAVGTMRDQTSLKIATYLTNLTDKAEVARKTWNGILEDLETERKLMKKAQERSGLDFGPLQGGKMFYAPHRENKTMVKSSEAIILDIWNIINGAGMLDLSFNRLLHHMTNLRKSIKHEMRSYGPSKFTIVTNIIVIFYLS